jgi:hypothetical protein
MLSKECVASNVYGITKAVPKFHLYENQALVKIQFSEFIHKMELSSFLWIVLGWFKKNPG